jgi:hypothetical protein
MQELASKSYFSQLANELKPGYGGMSVFLGFDMRLVNNSSFAQRKTFPLKNLAKQKLLLIRFKPVQ